MRFSPQEPILSSIRVALLDYRGDRLGQSLANERSANKTVELLTRAWFVTDGDRDTYPGLYSVSLRKRLFQAIIGISAPERLVPAYLDFVLYTLPDHSGSTAYGRFSGIRGPTKIFREIRHCLGRG